MDATQIILNQLPYTGFDYGPMYNSLFWVALSIWSLIVAAIIIKNKTGIGRAFSRLTAIFATDRQVNTQDITDDVSSTEPVILSERVIRYNPLADVQVQIPQQSQAITPILNQVQIPEVSEDVKDLVRDIVTQELSISREGESQDEFSQDDFATADFDGVNPDVYWQSREGADSMIEKIEKEEYVPRTVEKTTVQQEPQIEQAKVVDTMAPKKIFQDKITLDKSSEYPKILLSRTEIGL